MANKKIVEGDVFIFSDVTIGEETLSLKNQIRLGKVVFLSKITKKAIGVIISHDTFSEIPNPNSINEIKFTNTIFYTGNQFLKNGYWEIVGNQPVTEAEKDLTLRLIGNSLWKLDTNLGVISNADRKKYNKQLIHGFGALYSIINQL